VYVAHWHNADPTRTAMYKITRLVPMP